MKTLEYPITIRRLSAEEGGGYFVEFPDLPGCMADGDTIEEAITEATDAMASWINTAKEFGDPIPNPGETLSGKWNQRVPKALHSRLVARAKREGVSLNTLVIAMLSEMMGQQSNPAPLAFHGEGRSASD